MDSNDKVEDVATCIGDDNLSHELLLAVRNFIFIGAGRYYFRLMERDTECVYVCTDRWNTPCRFMELWARANPVDL